MGDHSPVLPILLPVSETNVRRVHMKLAVRCLDIDNRRLHKQLRLGNF